MDLIDAEQARKLSLFRPLGKSSQSELVVCPCAMFCPSLILQEAKSLNPPHTIHIHIHTSTTYYSKYMSQTQHVVVITILKKRMVKEGHG